MNVEDSRPTPRLRPSRRTRKLRSRLIADGRTGLIVECRNTRRSREVNLAPGWFYIQIDVNGSVLPFHQYSKKPKFVELQVGAPASVVVRNESGLLSLQTVITTSPAVVIVQPRLANYFGRFVAPWIHVWPSEADDTTPPSTGLQ